MLAGRNRSGLEQIDPAIFYSENIRSRLQTEENATRPGASFLYTCYPEYQLTLDRKCFSKSLIDLTGAGRRQRIKESAMRVLCQRLGSPSAKSLQIPWTEVETKKEAGRRVTHLLMMHAWRCRREDTRRSRAAVDSLNNQVESLNKQLYVLRHLFDNEKTKREASVKDAHKSLLKIEEYHQERQLMIQEKEELEFKLNELLDSVMKLKGECESERSNFRAAKAETETWELRFKIENNKSKTLKEQNLILQEEIQAKEEKLIRQTLSLEELNERKKVLEEKLDSNLPLLNEAMAQINSAREKLKLSEELGIQQERLLMEKDEEINQLKAQIALMEEKLREQDESNGELAKLISDKTKELVLLQDKLEELTKKEKLWGNRVIKIVSLCTRIPIACFYTVATLLLPQPTYRSL